MDVALIKYNRKSREVVYAGANNPLWILRKDRDEIEQIKADVEPGVRGVLPVDGSIQYGGSADALSEAIETMSRNFIMALFILRHSVSTHGRRGVRQYT